MINALLKGIFTLIINLVGIILAPIDLLINSAFPSVANALSYVSDFFNYIGGLMSWILSWFHVSQTFLTFVVGYCVFRLTVPLLVHTIKNAVKWYYMLKP